jgi:predicted DNA-binding antitoxin AbrB/MazE fold protein
LAGVGLADSIFDGLYHTFVNKILELSTLSKVKSQVSQNGCGKHTVAPSGEPTMTLTVEAVYENGVLKPTRTLPLQEKEKVVITVKSVKSRVRQTAGLIGWTGSQEEADFAAMSPELDTQEDE